MILYFSGTGNSKYVAKQIAKITNDDLTNLNDKIKNNDFQKVICQNRIIFVLPTYAWRIPKIVEDWIRRTDLSDGVNTWFIMTCGSEIGNAAKYNKRICECKHLNYMGTTQIIMPENYIALFNSPDWDKAKKIITNANPFIQKAGEDIKNDNAFKSHRNSMYDRIMSGLFNRPFYKFIVKAKSFYVKDTCISCGKCVAKCPLNNISLKDGKPLWDKNCTHCMACISYCPKEAIEYGKASTGKPRYYCKK